MKHIVLVLTQSSNVLPSGNVWTPCAATLRPPSCVSPAGRGEGGDFLLLISPLPHNLLALGSLNACLRIFPLQIPSAVNARNGFSFLDEALTHKTTYSTVNHSTVFLKCLFALSIHLPCFHIILPKKIKLLGQGLKSKL